VVGVTGVLTSITMSVLDERFSGYVIEGGPAGVRSVSTRAAYSVQFLHPLADVLAELPGPHPCRIVHGGLDVAVCQFDCVHDDLPFWYPNHDRVAIGLLHGVRDKPTHRRTGCMTASYGFLHSMISSACRGWGLSARKSGP
jgi:hypothetical protein